MQYSVIENGQIARKLNIDPLHPQSFQLAVETATRAAGVGLSNIEMEPDDKLREFGILPDVISNVDFDRDWQTRSGPTETVGASEVLVSYVLTDRPDGEIKREQIAIAKSLAFERFNEYRRSWPTRTELRAYEDSLRAMIGVFKLALRDASGVESLKTVVNALTLPPVPTNG